MCLILSLLYSCGTNQEASESNPNNNPILCDTTEPVLENLLVDMQTWDTMDGSQAGSFIFASSPGYLNPLIYPFGEFIFFNKQIPNIEFRAQDDADIVSPMAGVIVNLDAKEDPGRGYSIGIKSNQDSCYTIYVDHIRNPTVELGDTVEAGDLLGIPGLFQTDQGQVELQINDDGQRRYVCALSLMNSSVQQVWSDKVSQLMQDWESVRSDSTIFDESAHVIPGCLETDIAYDDLVNEGP